MKQELGWFAAAAVALAAFPAVMHANSSGPDAGYSGAPGEQNCANCHLSGNGFGSVKVAFPNGLFYTPGAKQRLTVTVADASKIAWGFQATARQSNNTGVQAGAFVPADGFTQVICADTAITVSKEQFGVSPCPSAKPLQWIEHTTPGNQTGQARSASYTFDWTPPATNAGSVNFYVAGVASNGGGADNVYTAHYTLSVPVANQPNIQAGGVVNGASYQGAISPGSWVTISGSNLANTTRQAGSGDIVNNQLPTQLDGVSVTVDGKAAYVDYVSPTQLNVLAPSNISFAQGLAVQVLNNGLNSNPGTVTGQSAAPALFTWTGKYAVATRPDFSLAAPPDLFPGTTTVPAHPGDIIILWAAGLGPTNPAVAGGQLTPATQLAAVINTPTVTIGGISGQVIGAALAPGYPGLYQIAVQVPLGLSDGDQPIMVQVGSAQSQGGVYLTLSAAP